VFWCFSCDLLVYAAVLFVLSAFGLVGVDTVCGCLFVV